MSRIGPRRRRRGRLVDFGLAGLSGGGGTGRGRSLTVVGTRGRSIVVVASRGGASRAAISAWFHGSGVVSGRGGPWGSSPRPCPRSCVARGPRPGRGPIGLRR